MTDAPKSRWSFSLKTLFVVVTVAGCLMLLLLPVANYVAWRGYHIKGSDLIASMDSRRPSTVSPREWEVVHFWIGVAFANVCFSPDHVSLAELKRFNNDLDSKLQGKVDLNTVDWIWERLASTGPQGAGYVERFMPQYRDELESAQSSRSPALWPATQKPDSTDSR